MKTITKRWIGCGLVGLVVVLAVLCVIAGFALLVKKIAESAMVETKWKPRHHEATTITSLDAVPTPTATPTPTSSPITAEALGVIVRKEMDDAFKRGQELERLRNARAPENPFEGEEEKGVRLRKRGFVLFDADGNEWGRVHRLDDDEITKGLFPDTIVIESRVARPVTTFISDHWEVTFYMPPAGSTPTPPPLTEEQQKLLDAFRPTPTPSPTITPKEGN